MASATVSYFTKTSKWLPHKRPPICSAASPKVFFVNAKQMLHSASWTSTMAGCTTKKITAMLLYQSIMLKMFSFQKLYMGHQALSVNPWEDSEAPNPSLQGLLKWQTWVASESVSPSDSDGGTRNCFSKQKECTQLLGTFLMILHLRVFHKTIPLSFSKFATLHFHKDSCQWFLPAFNRTRGTCPRKLVNRWLGKSAERTWSVLSFDPLLTYN